jgi:prophage regulatory protein
MSTPPALSRAVADKHATRLIKLPELMLRTTLSRSEVYRRVHNDPTFPKPTTLGSRCVAWVEGEVDAYIHERIAQRDAKAVAA